MRIASALVAALALCLPAAANTVDFDGFNWSSFYGSEVLSVDGSNNLHVTTTANDLGYGIAALDPGTTWIQGTFNDAGPGTSPANQVWVHGNTGNLMFEGEIGAFGNFDPNQNLVDYRVYTNGVMTSEHFSTFARTAGLHTEGFQLMPNGDVQFLYDGVAVLTTTQAQWAIQDFNHAILGAGGTAANQEVTFLDFQATAPEPLSCGLVGAGFLALGLLRRKTTSSRRSISQN